LSRLRYVQALYADLHTAQEAAAQLPDHPPPHLLSIRANDEPG
jgi:hypothetical protein